MTDLTEREQRILADARAAKPITTWQEVADYVDEPTWARILGDLAPKSRAAALACRPCKTYPQPDLPAVDGAAVLQFPTRQPNPDPWSIP